MSNDTLTTIRKTRAMIESWSGTAFVAGESDIDDDAAKSALYSDLCVAMNWLMAIEEDFKAFEWQPIETFKDKDTETQAVIKWASGEVLIGLWIPEEQFWVDAQNGYSSDYMKDCQPQYWFPLPPEGE